jgi:hypothetical protein
MEIKTKHNIGDNLYYMRNNKIKKGVVSKVVVKVQSLNKIEICYKLDSWVYEKCLFITKEELIKTLVVEEK